MAQSTFSGPIRVGTTREGAAANLGHVVLSQTANITHANVEVNTSTGIIIPANSQIIDIKVEVLTAWDSATGAALEIGGSVDVDLFADVAALKTPTGRSTVTVDATQAAVWDDVGTSDVTVYAKITETGAAAAGSANITVLYAQK